MRIVATHPQPCTGYTQPPCGQPSPDVDDGLTDDELADALVAILTKIADAA